MKENTIGILGSRYKWDGKAVLNLNDYQLSIKSSFEKKVNDKTYSFVKTHCVVCGQNEFENVSAKDRYGLFFPVGICKICGLLQATYRMDSKSYGEFYNLYYRQLYHGVARPFKYYYQRQYNKGDLILKYLQKNDRNISNRKSVLEIGCGMGGILKFFKDRGFSVKGVDLGEQFILYGKEKLELDLEVGTIHDLNIGEPPDLVIINHVLEHLLDPAMDLKKLYTCLNENSLVYISIPGVKLMTKKKELDFLRYLQNAHIYYFSLKTLKNLMYVNGFDFVTGNEGIMAIFKKRKLIDSKLTFENDFSDMQKALIKHELKFIRYSIFPYSLLKLPKNIFKTIRGKYRLRKAKALLKSADI